MRGLLGFLAAAFILGPVNGSRAESYYPRTIRQDLADNVKAVVYGRLENARKKDDPRDPGQTDLIVQDVLLAHPLLKDRKVIVYPRYLPNPDPKKPLTAVAFADMYLGKLDFFSIKQADERGVAYIRGIMKLDPRKPVESLRYFLNHLEDPSDMIATDAHLELSRAGHAVRHEAARDFSAKKILAWLGDPDIVQKRGVEYALLLASCGKPSDADKLFELWKEKVRKEYVFTMLTLKAKEYEREMKTIAADPKSPFLQRYSVYAGVLMLGEAKSTAFPKAKQMEFMEIFLDQGDMADFAIHEFRKWKRWEQTDRVLGLLDKKTHQAIVIRNAILRFAMEAPGPEAAAFVAKMRKMDRERVEYYEELIDQEKKEKAEKRP